MRRHAKIRCCGYLWVAVATATACGGDDGGGGLAQLPPGYEEALEAWKRRPFKSCDALDALGLSEAPGATYVDVAALVAANDGSLTVRSDDGAMVMLDTPAEVPGVSTSNTEITTTLNGETYSLKVGSGRDGSRCAIQAFGETLAEVALASTLTATAFLPATLSDNEGVTTTVESQQYSNPPLTQVRNPGWIEALTQVFQPTKAAWGVFAARFGITAEAARDYIRLAPGFNQPMAVRWNGAEGLWLSRADDALVGASASLAPYRSGEAVQLEATVRIRPSTVSWNQTVINTADAGTWSLGVTLDAEPVPQNRPNAPPRYITKVISATAPTRIAWDTVEADVCVKSRALTGLQLVSPIEPTLLQPSLADVQRPCFVLSEEAAYVSEGIWQKPEVAREILPGMLAGVIPAANYRYQGWDNAFTRSALQVLEAGDSIALTLDPGNQASVITELGTYIENFNAALPDLVNGAELKSRLLNLGTRWAFQGQAVGTTDIERLALAFDNAVEPFDASVTRALADLQTDFTAAWPQVVFAEEITADFKTQALAVKALTNDLEYERWVQNTFNKMLQAQPTLTDLQVWETQLTAVKAAIDAPAVSGLQPFRARVAAVGVRWVRDDSATPAQLPNLFAALAQPVVPFKSAVERLLTDLENDALVAHRTTLDFAASLNGQYLSAAVEVEKLAVAIELTGWRDQVFRNVLVNQTPLSTWQGWDTTLRAAGPFWTREQNRADSFNDRNWKTEARHFVTRGLDEDWLAADFELLETLSAPAVYLLSCQYYSTASLRADCARESSFSRSAGKLLDPAFGGRYAGLAAIVSTIGAKAEGKFKLQAYADRTLRAFYRGSQTLWSSCNDADFSVRSQQLTALITDLETAVNEFPATREFELSQQLNTLLNGSCP